MTDTPQPPAKPMLKPNMLRRALDEDKPSLGTHIMNSWPNITELVGHSGQFDYIEFVAEYAPCALLQSCGRASARLAFAACFSVPVRELGACR
eukprot:SAG31_NODE_2580_length_5438_cov_8.500843_3_plen_93_part_00